METRPKRIISKPLRYQTTSSDETPTPIRTSTASTTIGEINEDINDLRRTTQENMEHNETMNFSPQSHTVIQNQTSHTRVYIPKQTNELYTNIEPHTVIQPQKNVQVYSEINSQAHTDNQSHTNIEAYDVNSQTYIELQPYKSVETYSTNSQTHADIQSHTSIQSCSANTQPHTIRTYSRTSQNICAANVSQASHIPSMHNFTSHTQVESGKTIYTNDTLSDFQDNIIRTLSPQDSTVQQSQVHQELAHGQRTLTYAETIDNGRAHRMCGDNCTEHVATELKRMNTLLEKVLRCLQDRSHPSRKPAILPISSFIEMDIFETIDNKDYSDTVSYLNYIGGFNLKEAINLCFKEAIKDSLTPSFTWWGNNKEGQRSLYNARLTMAIYEAVCSNRHFEKPTRSEFQMQFREALRTAKERLRHRMRDSRTRSIGRERRNRDLWSDERSQEVINDQQDQE